MSVREEIKEAQAIKEALGVIEDEPETLVETLPDIIYVADITEEMGCEDEERFFSAAENRDDLVGCGETTNVGIYKLIAVQSVKKVEKVKTLATEFVAPDKSELDIELGKGGVTVAGEPAEIDSIGFAAVFIDD